MTSELGVDRIPRLAEDRADGMGDVADAGAGSGSCYACAQGALGCADHRDALRWLGIAHDEADGRVCSDSVFGDGEVECQQVAVGKRVVAGQSVEHGVVDGRADVVAERTASEGRLVVDVTGQRSGFEDHGRSPPVDVQQVCADCAPALQCVQDVSDQGACHFCPGQFGVVQDLNHAAPFSRDQ
ncbi:hypothetical protein D9M68_767860 [compost metagenome]